MQHDWPTREEARRAIFRYLETWYNPPRRHSTLGYVGPADYEQQLQAAAQFLSPTRPPNRYNLITRRARSRNRNSFKTAILFHCGGLDLEPRIA
jgi:hypothetical protein